MNNKGQSLILFILLIPIGLLLLVSVYEIGKLVLIKGELNDICVLALDYGLDHISDEDLSEKIRNLVLKNKEDTDMVNVLLVDDKLYVTLEDKIDDDLFLIGKFNGSKVKAAYVGYISNEKKIIERNN